MPEDEAKAAAAAQAQAAQQAPCAGCRTLRRRCLPGCVFAPYFPADGGGDPSRFAAVHRVFGASNAARMLGDVELPDDRRRAVETLVEEARARLRDPALGCLSYVAVLQMLNEKAREQVAAARAEIAAEFGATAAAEPVDVAAAAPEVWAEARAQAERALEHSREQDAKLLAARRAADFKWWQQQRKAGKHAGEGPRVPGDRRRKNEDTNEHVVAATENTPAAAAAAGESSSEQTMVTPPAAAGTDMQAPAEKQEPAPAAAEAAREEASATVQAPDAASPPHQDSAPTQLAGEGTSFLDMDQLAAAEVLAKRLDIIKQRRAAAAEQQYHGHPTAARRASMMGLDVAPDAQEAAAVAEAASGQDLMVMMLAQQFAEAGAAAAAELGMAMQLLPAGAAQYGNLAAQYDDVTLVHGHQDMRQPMTVAAAAVAGEVAGEQGMAVRHAATTELAAQEMMQLAQAQYAHTELDLALGQAIAQQKVQLAGAAKIAGEQDTTALAAAVELAGEQGNFTQQAAAAELAREQRDMTLLLQVAAAMQNPVAQYSETELGISLGHQPTVQEQQLADAVGVAGEPNTATAATTQQVAAAYKDGEHGSDYGATAAFQPPGVAEAVPFLLQQRSPPQGRMGRALGLQMDSSLLPPPPPSLGQPLSEVAQQQDTGGGDEGQSSDLTAYVYY